jgi:Mlc titration factor MtfA (ptsG expression regulator)
VGYHYAMTIAWIILPLVIAALWFSWWFPRYRLSKALARPFPDDWVGIVEQNIAVYKNLPMPLRIQLRRLIKQFLHEKKFTGCNGLEITDEIRVTVAAEACMLLLHRDTGVYPGLKYILVYPRGFMVSRDQHGSDGVVESNPQHLLGESWSKGKVILAWDHVVHGGRNFVDGQNLVLHEFAHQLDAETGMTDGAPVLLSANSYRGWASALSAEYEVLQKKARRGKRSLMDHYGATNPAEFFAVATETFFEQPAQMAKHHEELFETLKAYYRIDPRDWQKPSTRSETNA